LTTRYNKRDPSRGFEREKGSNLVRKEPESTKRFAIYKIKEVITNKSDTFAIQTLDQASTLHVL
jgi:hypothetical protein